MELIVDGKRYDTDKMQLLVDRQATQQHGTGVTLLGIWQTKDGRVLVVTDSVWARSSGSSYTVGVTGHFAGEEEVARLADRYDGPGGALWELVPSAE